MVKQVKKVSPTVRAEAEAKAAISALTRSLSAASETSYLELVANVAARFKAPDANEFAIRYDALYGKLGAILQGRDKAAGKAKPREAYNAEVETLLGNGNSQHKDVVNAVKWFNRLRSAAGFASTNAQGGARDASRTENKSAPVEGATKGNEKDTPKASKLPSITPEMGALEIGTSLRLGMLKVLNASPKAFEADDTARKVALAMQSFTSSMLIIEKAHASEMLKAQAETKGKRAVKDI